MKKILTILLIIVLTIPAFSQDIITKTDGNEIKAKVQEISILEIKYKKFENIEGPTYTILKSEVFMIKYENGSKDVFGDTEKKEEQEEQPNYSTLYQPKEQQQTENNTYSSTSNDNTFNSYVGSLSAGYGTTHAGLGAKLLLGWWSDCGNRGFFLAAGTFNEYFFWSAGLQAPINESNWYWAWSFGNVGTRTITSTTYINGYSNSNSSIEKIAGTSVTCGYKIKLDSENRFFIDLGLGGSYGWLPSDPNQEFWFVALDAALGLRF